MSYGGWFPLLGVLPLALKRIGFRGLYTSGDQTEIELKNREEEQEQE
jgi:hypothetical protein